MSIHVSSLGADHDGYRNGCSGTEQYVMASSMGYVEEADRDNPYQFSHCSISAFRDYLFYLRM